MHWVTVSLLLVLFLGTGCCQEPDAGSTAEDSLEANDRPDPDKLEMMCADLEKDKSTQPCANDTEGIPITLPGLCGREQTCRYRLFTCRRPFEQAQCQCRAIGGSLVAISNARQNREIQQIVRRQCSAVSQVWIGLQKTCRAYHYSYINGSPCKYRNWECGQPVRSGNQCGALQVHSGKWRSLQCSASIPFICRV